MHHRPQAHYACRLSIAEQIANTPRSSAFNLYWTISKLQRLSLFALPGCGRKTFYALETFLERSCPSTSNVLVHYWRTPALETFPKVSTLSLSAFPVVASKIFYVLETFPKRSCLNTCSVLMHYWHTLRLKPFLKHSDCHSPLSLAVACKTFYALQTFLERSQHKCTQALTGTRQRHKRSLERDRDTHLFSSFWITGTGSEQKYIDYTKNKLLTLQNH